MFELILRSFIELALISFFFLWLSQQSNLFIKIKRLGPRRHLSVLAFFLVMFIVQMLDRWQYFFPPQISFYPFVRFAMYQVGEPQDKISTYKFIGDFNEKEIEINPTIYFEAISLPSLSTRFKTISKDLQGEIDEKKSRARNDLRMYCDSIFRKLHSLNMKLPLKIDFVSIQYRLQDNDKIQEIGRETLFSYTPNN